VVTSSANLQAPEALHPPNSRNKRTGSAGYPFVLGISLVLGAWFLEFYPVMPESTIILNALGIQRALTRIAHEIAERNEVSSEVVLVGIQRGGVPLAEHLAALLSGIVNLPIPAGSLDVGMHRDDLDQRVAPKIHPTQIPFDVTGKTVVLVDDVLFSGRTIRAAMDSLNDFGRPKRIQLAVLVDRGHRELPIKADFVGKNQPTSPNEKVHVRIGEPGHEDEVVIERP
jgi:pyrimidine operon attenuation protein / uracil phosphoribosyltransferase